MRGAILCGTHNVEEGEEWWTRSRWRGDIEEDEGQMGCRGGGVECVGCVRGVCVQDVRQLVLNLIDLACVCAGREAVGAEPH